jgi:MoxR-like ATPase
MSDLIGTFMPSTTNDDACTGQYFEFIHGPLLTAMIDGSFVLLDEV